MKTTIISLLIIAISFSAACGSSDSTSSSDGFSVLSVTINSSDQNTALTSTYDGDRLSGAVANTTFTATFDVAADGDTMTTATDNPNIELICSGVTQEIDAATTSAGAMMKDSNTVWTITPAAALTGYSDCTLTFGTGIASVDGIALSEEQSFAFTSQCSTDDTFVVDTFGTDLVESVVAGTFNTYTGNCWTFLTAATPTTIPFAVDTENQRLVFTGNETTFLAATSAFLIKELPAPDVTMTAYISDYENNEVNGRGCGIAFLGGGSDLTAYVSYLFTDEENPSCLIALGGAEPEIENIQSDCTPPLYFQIVKTGDTLKGYYGSSLDRLESIGTSGTITQEYSGDVPLYGGPLCSSDNNSPYLTVYYDSITFSETATGPGTQY